MTFNDMSKYCYFDDNIDLLLDSATDQSLFFTFLEVLAFFFWISSLGVCWGKGYEKLGG